MNTFDYVHITLNSFSLISCVLLINHGSQTIDTLNNPKTLVILLGISRLVVSFIEIFLTLVDSQNICSVMGPAKDFANWTAISWSCLMSLWTILAYKNYSSLQLMNRFKGYCALAVLVSLLLTLTPVFNIAGLAYVYKDGFCTMDALNVSMGLRSTIFLLLTSIPFLTLFALTLCASLNGLLFFRNLPKQFVAGYELSNMKLIQYPIAHLLVYFPDVVDSILIHFRASGLGFFGEFGIYCNDLAGLINYIVYRQQFVKKHKEDLNKIETSAGLLDDLSSPEIWSP